MTQRLVIPSREEVDGDPMVAHPWWQFPVRFNVAITQSIPVARMHERESEGTMMRWGLVRKAPAGDIEFSRRGLARGDALQTTPELREAWTNGQRGIVPLAGFYLWQRTPMGHLQPFYVRVVNRPVFGVAVLWDRVEADDGEVHESCALITVDANPLISELDNSGQMPLILPREDYATWLSDGVANAQSLLRTFPYTSLVCYPVAPHVNHLQFDEPGLIRPLRNQPDA
jgi:putative SOS response-associated peptidase YedK